MFINVVKSVNATNYYLNESYRNEKGQCRTRIVEKLGNEATVREKFNLDPSVDILGWLKEYAKQRTANLKESSNRTVSIELSEDAAKGEHSNIYNFGYLVLDSLFHEFGIANICEEIKAKHPHVVGFNLENVLRAMLFGRILNPSSKRRLTKSVQNCFLESSNIELQHAYRAMDLLEQHNDLIQKRLYQYSSIALKNRNVSRLYYDCTNFFTEKEIEDCDVEGKSEEWYDNHTLRKYGKSKENRPNPIVQMGLFMDGDGMPLGFNINPGNTNEQITMQPLEKELIDNFSKTDIVVCTDAGLASFDNRRYNNVTEDTDPATIFGLKGKRHFICVQSIKGLKDDLKQWALDKTGWSYVKKTGNMTERVSGFDISTLAKEQYSQFYDVVFYKERTIAEKGLDQRLIMTFSIKFLEYQKKLRQRKIARANKMIDNGTYKQENDRNPKSLISQEHTTSDGVKATKTKAKLNQEKIDSDAMYDGFYCTATNLFKEECSLEQIIAIGQRRWEIEECFRIMKTDLKSRPFYHSKDSRIKAHFQTCFIALLLVRAIEQKIAKRNPENSKYPDGKYTVVEILDAIRSMNVISVKDGLAYMPDYTNSELITELLEIFDLKKFDRQIVMKDTLKKILKKIKNSPEMIKDEKSKL